MSYGQHCERSRRTEAVLFVAPDGARKAVRLGKTSQRAAEAVKFRMEQLLAALLTGHPLEADTASWLAALDARLAKKLAAVGLMAACEAKPAATLGAFLTAYIDGRTDVKPLTTRHMNDARRNLIAFFSEEKPLAEITPGDADDFRRDLLRRLGDNTVRRQCGRAKQFFRAAVRKRLIRENPFGDMKGCGVQANRTRDYFLTREDAAKVLDACPDSQWRLIFALARFGGLRCPSEHLALTWADVDWERDRVRVASPKTEHHAGGESRTIPIFPELRPYLEQAWDEAAPGTEFVVTRYRDANANMRTQLERIIHRAGLEPWPKLFHNLRASRATELAANHPAHVAAAWLGHSTLVAQKHYWQVTDDDFRDAAQVTLNASGQAAQKAAQRAHATERKEPQAAPGAHEKTPVLPGFATLCDIVHICSVPPVGDELQIDSVGSAGRQAL